MQEEEEVSLPPLPTLHEMRQKWDQEMSDCGVDFDLMQHINDLIESACELRANEFNDYFASKALEKIPNAIQRNPVFSIVLFHMKWAIEQRK